MGKATGKRHEDEPGNFYEREERFFCLDAHWYFTTREGVIMGPYGSRAEATTEARNFIHFVSSARKPLVNLLVREKMTVEQDSAPD